LWAFRAYDADGTAAVEVSRYDGAELLSAVEAAGTPPEAATASPSRSRISRGRPRRSIRAGDSCSGDFCSHSSGVSLLGVYVIERFIRRRQNR
jgi:hypothetical protein